MTSLPQIEFSPEVLARIAPDVLLKRHLALGYRPNLRKFTEFNGIEATRGGLGTIADGVVGSLTIKSGSTTVLNTIALTLVEDDGSDQLSHVGVYPVVDVLRGRLGAPTDEEMILSQALYEAVYHARVLPRDQLQVKHLGLSVDEENGSTLVYYDDINPDEYSLLEQHPKRYRYVLNLNIKVFSKQTLSLSLFDLCYVLILEALALARLPRVYVLDLTNITKVVRLRRSTKRGVVLSLAGTLNLDTNHELMEPIALGDGGQLLNFGVFDNTLLCDLAGEPEEAAVMSRILVTADTLGRLKRVQMVNGDVDNVINLDQLRQALELAKARVNT